CCGVSFMVFPPLVFLFPSPHGEEARSAVSNHEAPIVSVAHPSRRRFAAPQDEDLHYAALSVALSLSSVIRPAVSACASAAAAAPAACLCRWSAPRAARPHAARVPMHRTWPVRLRALLPARRWRRAPRRAGGCAPGRAG